MGADFDRLKKVLEERERRQCALGARTLARQRSARRTWALPVGIFLLGQFLILLLSAMWWWPAPDGSERVVETFSRAEPASPVGAEAVAPISAARTTAAVHPSPLVAKAPVAAVSIPSVESEIFPPRPREAAAVPFSQQGGSGPFVVLEAVREGDTVEFRRRRMDGIERAGASRDARRRVPSVNQRDFPEPESGCGPAAVVNWLLWLQQEGLLRKPIEGADPRVLALHNFRSVEREFYGLRGARRQASRGGSQIDEITASMDRLVHRLSGGELRMHHELFKGPLRIEDWIKFTSGYRAGILITRVVEDPSTRRLGGYHAVSLVAGDRAGGVMLNNWGENVYGTLRNEAGGQFFYPKNVEQPALKIESAVCFIPFRPTEDVPLAVLDTGDFGGRSGSIVPSRIAAGGRRRESASAVTNAFQVTWVSQPQRNRGWVYAITNQSSTSRIVYLGTFQGEFTGGRRFFPTDIRTADWTNGRLSPIGDRARLFLSPGETRRIWLQFDHLQVGSTPPVRLIEV